MLRATPMRAKSEAERCDALSKCVAPVAPLVVDFVPRARPSMYSPPGRVNWELHSQVRMSIVAQVEVRDAMLWTRERPGLRYTAQAV